MMTLRKANERGQSRTDWLESYHTFSFADYHDPKHVHFGPLRVLNDDVVAPGAGFPAHPHRDMEIVTYILSGELAHKDSIGTGSVIRPGEIQRMSAGKGIVHSEFNASNDKDVHLLQIWLFPRHEGAPPSYEQKQIPEGAVKNALHPIVVPRDGDLAPDGAVSIDQDATLYAAKLGAGHKVVHPLAPGRRAWLHVAKGSVKANGKTLGPGDGAGFIDEADIALEGVDGGEVLLFDLP